MQKSRPPQHQFAPTPTPTPTLTSTPAIARRVPPSSHICHANNTGFTWSVAALSTDDWSRSDFHPTSRVGLVLPTAGSFCPQDLETRRVSLQPRRPFLFVCLASARIPATQPSATFGHPAARRRPLRAAKANPRDCDKQDRHGTDERRGEEEGVLVDRQTHTHTVPIPLNDADASQKPPVSNRGPHPHPSPSPTPGPSSTTLRSSASLPPTAPRPRASIKWTATCRLNALLSLLYDTHSPVLETFPGQHECPIRCRVTREPSATPLAPSSPTAQVPPTPPGRWRVPSHKDVRYQFPRANWQGLDESR